MIITCTEIAKHWLAELAKTISSESLTPRLGIVQVGSAEAATRFIKKKREAADKLGIQVQHKQFAPNLTTSALQQQVTALAKQVDGLIVQLPLPSSLQTRAILDAVPPAKDIDGLGAAQLAALVRNEHGFVPATVRGILYFLESYKIPLAGTRIAIVGLGQLVGRPLALALANRGATLLLADKQEKQLTALLSSAEVVVSATGVPGTLTGKHVHKNLLVLDAGFSIKNGKIVGDVETDTVAAAGARVTPVPGGLGALTVAALFANLLDALHAKA
ncbi:MAG: bifunctional 5,10-methylenetetrahydrofolate dehydrogenase/5,10-methenyltetrahydrofolate cyclohydrolase [Candidatus Andersenbacteria bacterium]